MLWISTSFNPKNEIIKITIAINPDVAQGRKYGCCRKYCIRPKVSGHLVAGLEREPPIMGLGERLSMATRWEQLMSLRNRWSNTQRQRD